MKRSLVLVTITLAMTSLSYLLMESFSSKTSSVDENKSSTPASKYWEKYKDHFPKEAEEEGIKEAFEYINRKRIDPSTGKIDMGAVQRARNEMFAHRNKQHSSRRQGLDLNWQEIGPDNVGGRTRAIVIDNQDPNKMFAGSVTGGIFVSYNGGLSWSPHPDNPKLRYQGVGCMAQAPNGDIYVGTGETFPGSATIIGSGIYKSTNRGETFDFLPSTFPTDSNSSTDGWAYVNEIAVSPLNASKVYAATKGGLMISSDGGNTWVNANTGGAGNGEYYEVVVGGNGTVYAATRTRYYRSIDPDNFELRSDIGGFPNTNVSRIEFAVSPQDANYVYAVLSNNSDGLRAVYKSTDGGITWSKYSPENSSTFNPLGEQGTYDMTIAVDPANKDRVFVGGQLELIAGGNDVGWDQIAFWAPRAVTNPYYVHADMHKIVFHPTNPNIMFIGTDGGIFKSLNASSQFPTFTERNKGYNVTQFYNISASSAGEVLAGAQDNGTSYIDLQGNTVLSAQDVGGGDGGFTAISEINPLAFFTSIQLGELRRSSNGGESFSCLWDKCVDNNDNCQPDAGSDFIAPYTLWEKVNYVYSLDSVYIATLGTTFLFSGDSLIKREVGKPDTIIATGDWDSTYISSPLKDTAKVFHLEKKELAFVLWGGVSLVYVTPDALNFSGNVRWFRIGGFNGLVNCFDQTEDGTFYIGTGGGSVYRLTGIADYNYPASTVGCSNININVPKVQIANNSTWGLSGSVEGIGVNPNNPDDLVVTLGGYFRNTTPYVFRCTSATTANLSTPCFQGIQGDLPHFPVYDAVIDYYNPDNIIIGTDLGIWATNDGGLTWNEENQGMSPVPVYTLVQKKLYDQDCQAIYAGTFGRGVFWTTTLLEANRGNACTTERGLHPVGIAENPKSFSNNSLVIYPNPAVEKVFLDIELTQPETINILLIDLTGKVVKTFNQGKINEGKHEFELDCSNVAGGVYLVNVKVGNALETRRLFVTK